MRFIRTKQGRHINVNTIKEVNASGKGDDRKYVAYTKDGGKHELYYEDYETLTEVIGRHLGCVQAQSGWYVVSISRDDVTGKVWTWKEPITAWRIDVDGQSFPVTCDKCSYQAVLSPDGTVEAESGTCHATMDEFIAVWEREHPVKSAAVVAEA